MAIAPKFAPASVAESLRQQASVRAAQPAVRIWLALGTVYLLWGSTYLGIKFSLETIPPYLMGSLRFLVAGGVLYLVAVRTGDAAADRVGPRQWWAALIIGAALLLGGNGGVILAEQYVPTGIVALLVGTAPLWMAVIDRLVLGPAASPLVLRGPAHRLRRPGVPGCLASAWTAQPVRGYAFSGGCDLLVKRRGLHPSR